MPVIKVKNTFGFDLTTDPTIRCVSATPLRKRST
jgi:hypothetical protein